MTDEHVQERPKPQPRVKWYLPASLMVIGLFYLELAYQPETGVIPPRITAEMVFSAVMGIQGTLLVVVLLCLAFLGYESKSRVAELEMDRFYDTDLVRGSVLGGFSFLVVLGIAFLTERAANHWGVPLYSESPWGSMIARSTFGGKVMIALGTLLVAPIVEEIVFRHTIYRAAKIALPHWCAAIASAGVFAIAHGDLAGIPAFFVLALLFQEAYRRTGRLYVPITMHATFNAFMLTFSQWVD